MKSVKIVLYVMPHTNLLDLGGVIQAFAEAKELGLSLETVICGDGKEVSTIAGFVIQGICRYDEVYLHSGDYLLIMSAHHSYIFSNKFTPEEKIKTWLRDQYKKGVKIGAVCNGAFLLGKAGLLNHLKCTTHWKRTQQLAKMFPSAKVQKNILFIEDQNIITSAGSASGIDLALHIIGELKNEFYSHIVARELVVFNRRSGEQEQQNYFLQYRNHYHQGIHRAQEHIVNNINKDLSTTTLSKIANMSERNFCRIFKKETSLTVVGFINSIRSVYIHEMMKQPDLNKQQMAYRIGLKSERQVNRIIAEYLAE